MGDTDGDGDGDGEIADCILMPLFQISFFPDLMQVYLRLATVLVALNLVHVVPEIEAELAGIRVMRIVADISDATRSNLLRSIWREYYPI